MSQAAFAGPLSPLNLGELTIISGPTGSGKTTILYEILEANVQNHRILLASLDTYFSREDYQRLSRGTDNLTVMSSSETVTRLLQVVSQYQPTLVLIDALHYLYADKNVEALEALRIEGVAVVATLQTNREAFGPESFGSKPDCDAYFKVEKTNGKYTLKRVMDYGDRQERAEKLISRILSRSKSYTLNGVQYTAEQMVEEIRNMSSLGRTLVAIAGMLSFTQEERPLTLVRS